MTRPLLALLRSLDAPSARHASVLLLMAALFNFALAHPSRAQEQDGHVFSVIEENDQFYGSFGKNQDRHYTQGLKLIYLEPGASPTSWAQRSQLARVETWLPNVWMDSRGTNFGLLFGQNIYTPEDKAAYNLVTDDRPYAGWMYIGLAIQRRGATALDIPVLESFELDLGVIGPEAQGEASQNLAHQVAHDQKVNGWGNQLHTEPAFAFKYGRIWKLAINETSGRYFDITPDVGVNLGTVQVSGNMGATARLGFNLPDDFGVQTIDSPIVLANGKSRGQMGFYLFGQVEGRAIARDAFLDGNLYQDSFHVTPKPFVADMVIGLALTWGSHFDLSWTSVVRTEQFDGQRGDDRFGSIMAKIKWGF